MRVTKRNKAAISIVMAANFKRIRLSPCKGLLCTKNARDFSPYISSCKLARLRTHSALIILEATGRQAQPVMMKRPNLCLAPNNLIQVVFHL